MRFVRFRESHSSEDAEGTGLALPFRPRLGIQFDAGPDGHGGTILPLDALPGIPDDSDRARALDDADLAAYLAADVELVAARAGLERLPDRSGLVIDASSVRFLAPVHRPQKTVCIGYNYRSHVNEQQRATPDRPALFAKWANAIVGDGDAVVTPNATHALDLEGELGVVIGTRCRRVPAGLALAHVAGWTALNDVTARDLQGQKVALGPDEHGDGQWARAKSSDTFLPMGPGVVTIDEIPDVSTLTIRSWRTDVQGNRVQMQEGSPRDLIFGVAELIEFISANITLEPGDIIATGTPSGVGVFRDPPVFLQPGDVVSVEVSGIGRVDNPIVAYDETVPEGSPATDLVVRV